MVVKQQPGGLALGLKCSIWAAANLLLPNGRPVVGKTTDLLILLAGRFYDVSPLWYRGYT